MGEIHPPITGKISDHHTLSFRNGHITNPTLKPLTPDGRNADKIFATSRKLHRTLRVGGTSPQRPVACTSEPVLLVRKLEIVVGKGIATRDGLLWIWRIRWLFFDRPIFRMRAAGRVVSRTLNGISFRDCAEGNAVRSVRTVCFCWCRMLFFEFCAEGF